MIKQRLFRLEYNKKLVAAAYNKSLLFNFARKHWIKGTIVEQYEPEWVIRHIKQRNKLLTGNALINVN